jgi:hypothetical protein
MRMGRTHDMSKQSPRWDRKVVSSDRCPSERRVLLAPDPLAQERSGSRRPVFPRDGRCPFLQALEMRSCMEIQVIG